MHVYIYVYIYKDIDKKYVCLYLCMYTCICIYIYVQKSTLVEESRSVGPSEKSNLKIYIYM
jgi:hypothetical protein